MGNEFLIKKLIAGKGFFCKVNYEIVHNNANKPSLEFIDSSNSTWYDAATFAFKYFVEKYPKEKNFSLKIIKIEHQVVDTSSTVVVFSIISILEKELVFQIPGFNLDDFGNLILPK